MDRKPTEKVAGILRRGSCGVKTKDTIPSGGVAKPPRGLETPHLPAEKFPAESSFLLYNPFGLAHNLCFR